LLPFLALAAASLGLPLVWPLLAQTLASPILEGASGAFWPVALGGALASGVAVYAYAQRIGPALFVSHLTAPFRALGARVGSIMTARRRAARRLGHAVPKALGSTATSWRLGQTAIAGLIALTLTIEMRASLHPEAAIPPAPQQGQPSSQAP